MNGVAYRMQLLAVTEAAVMEGKSVLVSFQERNKVLKLFEDGDLKVLEKEFRKAFKLDSEASLVTFQRYDTDWGEYVDLDDECTLQHKDKVKAVVSSVVTPEVRDIHKVLCVCNFCHKAIDKTVISMCCLATCMLAGK